MLNWHPVKQTFGTQTGRSRCINIPSSLNLNLKIQKKLDKFISLQLRGSMPCLKVCNQISTTIKPQVLNEMPDKNLSAFLDMWGARCVVIPQLEIEDIYIYTPGNWHGSTVDIPVFCTWDSYQIHVLNLGFLPINWRMRPVEALRSRGQTNQVKEWILGKLV